jgi:hypothetical protein
MSKRPVGTLVSQDSRYASVDIVLVFIGRFFMSKKVNGKNKIGLISLDQKIEVIVIRELLQMGYAVKNFGLDLNTISKSELNSVDLIVAIPSESFNEDELQLFLSEIVLFFPNIQSIVTTQSNSIKSHLNR